MIIGRASTAALEAKGFCHLRQCSPSAPTKKYLGPRLISAFLRLHFALCSQRQCSVSVARLGGHRHLMPEFLL